MSTVPPQGGPWSLLTPGEVAGLAHSRIFFLFLLVKKFFNLSLVISPDIWGKRGLFLSEFGLRRGYIGKAELSLCSHWVTSIDISKCRLNIIRSSGVSVHWTPPEGHCHGGLTIIQVLGSTFWACTYVLSAVSAPISPLRLMEFAETNSKPKCQCADENKKL